MVYKVKATSGLSPCPTVLSQQVIVDGAVSDQASMVSGVLQGTVRGPLLSLLFINDLPNCVMAKISIFADDCVIYRLIKDSYKMICTDWQSGKTNWGCVSIQKNAVSLELLEQDNQFCTSTH